jgi:hypothetical protein
VEKVQLIDVVVVDDLYVEKRVNQEFDVVAVNCFVVTVVHFLLLLKLLQLLVHQLLFQVILQQQPLKYQDFYLLNVQNDV